MSKIVSADDDNFETEVLQSNIPVLVDFSAAWCGPCVRQTPILEKYAADNLDKVKVVKIDIDDAPQVAAKFGIRSIPTLMVFNGGKSLGYKAGLSSLAEVDNLVLTKMGA